jgi:hypothetical protein
LTPTIQPANDSFTALFQQRLLFMGIQLLLPPAPVFFNLNAVLAANSSCSHLRDVFTGFIVSHVFAKKMPLFIKARSSFSFSSTWQYRFQKFAAAVIIGADNVIKLNV